MSDGMFQAPALPLREQLQAAFRQFATGVENIPGMEGLSRDDLGQRATMLSIVGSVTDPTDTARPGDYRLGKDVIPRPEVVFVRVRGFRQLISGEGKDSKTTCFSSNAQIPDASVPNKKSDACGDGFCPFGTWDTDPATNKRKPPKCQNGLALLGICLNSNPPYRPFWFPVRSTKVKPVQDFLQDVVSATQRGECQGPPSVKVTLGSEQKVGQGSGPNVPRWYIPILTGEPLPDPAPFLELAEQVKDVVYSVPARADDAPVATAAGGAQPLRGVVDVTPPPPPAMGLPPLGGAPAMAPAPTGGFPPLPPPPSGFPWAK